MDDEANALARILETIERFQQISLSSSQQVQAISELTEHLAGQQAQIKTALESSAQAVRALNDSTRQLDSEAEQVLGSLAGSVTSLLSEVAGLRPGLEQAWLGQQQAVSEIAGCPQAQVPGLIAQAQEACELIGTTQLLLQSLTLQSTGECQRLGRQVAIQRQALADLRQQLEAQCHLLDQENQQLSDSLNQQFKLVQVGFENARQETQQRVDQLLGETGKIRAEADARFQERWAGELAQEIGTLAIQLDQTVQGLQDLAKPTRKMADSEVLTSTQKVREGFDPLQRIEKAFRAAHQAEVC
ncbi:MAG: hypothetical protein U0931_28430 [Vulcanimicrobiota bacterium]